MNTTHTHSTLNAAAELGCRIQIWHLRPGATSSADGQWDDADPTVKPTFECPEHLYRVHPDDLHLLRADNERRARELLAIHGACIRLLSEIVCVHQTDDQLDGEVIPRPPVMLAATRLREQLDKLSAIVAALEEAPAGAGEPAGSVDSEAEAWQYKMHGHWHTTVSDEPWRSKGLEVRPLYTRPAPAVVDEAHVGTEIMVNAPQGVYQLQLQPSGLNHPSPQFVVHVSESDTHDTNEDSAQAAVDEATTLLREFVAAWDFMQPRVLSTNGADCFDRMESLHDKVKSALAQPQGREAVDLEQFREAVECAIDEIGWGEAERLLALIDVQSNTTDKRWSGWATQSPGSLPKLWGDRAIAELNWHPESGDLIKLVEVARIDAQSAKGDGDA